MHFSNIFAAGDASWDGNSHPLLSNEAVARVFKRLADRLQGVVSDTSTITITPEYAAHFLEVYVKKTDGAKFTAPSQKQAFEYGCADGSGQGSRRGSHVYEINTWLWNFGRPQPRIGGLSVAKTEGVRRQSRSETSRRAAETKKARKRAVDQI